VKVAWCLSRVKWVANNGDIKIIYLEQDGYFRITPTKQFDALEEAALSVCYE